MGVMLRDAWRDYRRHARELWLCSAALSLPACFVVAVRAVVAADVALPLDGPSRATLALLDAVVGALTPAAVALLAAELRATGGGSWLQAWRRVSDRTAAVLTGHLAAMALLVGAVVLQAMVLQLVRGPLGQLIAIAGVAALVLAAAALFALLPVVTANGPEGGLAAVERAWRMLRANPANTFAPIVAAQLLARAPLVVAYFLLPQPGSPLIALLFRAWLVTALPFVTLVALSVYQSSASPRAPE
jgi:hypothetical protein